MRGSGLSIEVLIEYLTLFQKGDESINARKEILIEQRKILINKVEEMQKTIDRLTFKIERYENTVVQKEKELRKVD